MNIKQVEKAGTQAEQDTTSEQSGMKAYLVTYSVTTRVVIPANITDEEDLLNALVENSIDNALDGLRSDKYDLLSEYEEDTEIPYGESPDDPNYTGFRYGFDQLPAQGEI